MEAGQNTPLPDPNAVRAMWMPRLPDDLSPSTEVEQTTRTGIHNLVLAHT